MVSGIAAALSEIPDLPVPLGVGMHGMQTENSAKPRKLERPEFQPLT